MSFTEQTICLILGIHQLKVLKAKLTNELETNYGMKNNIQPGQLDVVVSNPPYILRKDMSKLDPEISL